MKNSSPGSRGFGLVGVGVGALDDRTNSRTAASYSERRAGWTRPSGAIRRSLAFGLLALACSSEDVTLIPIDNAGAIGSGPLGRAAAALSAGELEKIEKYLSERIDPGTVIDSIVQRGDTFDCVPLELQPSVRRAREAGLNLDDRIQEALRVSAQLEHHAELEIPEAAEESSEGTVEPSESDFEESCPEGSVAIRRIPVAEIAAYGSLEAYRKRPTPQALPVSTAHREYGNIIHAEANWGARARFNTWSPNVRRTPEHSLSQMWLVAGTGDDTETLETGWVARKDQASRMFTFFTNSNYENFGATPSDCTPPNECSCWNDDCGFVVTTSSPVLDATFSQYSVANGSQYERRFEILKLVGESESWCLIYQGSAVGFWPVEMFDQLDDEADYVKWGGEIYDDTIVSEGFHTTTNMGGDGTFGSNSGRWAHAAFLRQLEIRLSSGSGAYTTANPTVNLPSNTYLDNCYDVYLNYSSTSSWGRYMYHGGTGWHTSGSTSNYCACGNGVCQSPEDANNCPADCGCGNGTCQSPVETPGNCPLDC